MSIKPLHSNVIVKLPDYQKEDVRKTVGGLYVPKLEGKIQHDASTGEVVAIGDTCSICEVGDTVFFDYYTVMNAKQNVGRDKVQHEGTKKNYNGVPVHYFENGVLGDELPDLPKGVYIIMPEARIVNTVKAKDSIEERTMGCLELDIPLHLGIICLLRNGELKSCNGYYLIKRAYDNGELINGVNIKKSKIILNVSLKDVEQKEKQYEIICAPENAEYEVGAIIKCMPNVEIPLEGDFNCPQLPLGTYYIEKDLILATVECCVA